jgi:hypothetical protein
MWDIKRVIIPVTVRATGMVTGGLKRNLEAVREKHELDSLKIAVVHETSHIIRKVLQSEA